MTRKEAEAQAKELNEREPQWTCPLLGGKTCRTDCVNFCQAFVDSDEESKNGKNKVVSLHTTDDNDFYVSGFHCSNGQFISPMICGG